MEISILLIQLNVNTLDFLTLMGQYVKGDC